MWFKEMTDKAENLLNQMDKTAASALQKSKTQVYSKADIFPEEYPTPFQSDSAKKGRDTDDSKLNGTEVVLKEEINSSPKHSLELNDESVPPIAVGFESIINGTPKKKNPPRHLENGTQHLLDVEDLQEALASKDAQLSLLRIQLQEVEAKLSKVSNLLDEKTKEIFKLLEDQENSKSLHKQMQETLQSRIEELETLLKREQDISAQLKAASLKQMERLEDEKLNLTESYLQLERKLTSEKTKNREQANQMNLTQDYLEAVKQELEDYKNKAKSVLHSKEKQELEDYKNKAKSVLHSKEKLISTLQTQGHIPSSTSIPAPENTEALEEEISMLKRELSGLRQSLSDAQALIAIQQLEVDTQKQEVCKKDQQLSAKKAAIEKLELECQQLKQSAQYYHEDFLQMKTRFELQLKERDEQIESLRKQLMTKSLNSISQEELENRLHNLTEALIQKQTLVETLSSEKSSLILQLERMKQKQEEQVFSSSIVQIPDTELKLRGTTPSFESLHSGNGVTNRVKKAYSILDKVGARFAVFLGRHPHIRPLFLLYIVLLHAWVFVVLLTYTPEVHS